jgi:hypothetical protein
MRFKVCPWSGVYGGTGSLLGVIAATLFALGTSVGAAIAGDISAQPTDQLSISNSTVKLLPQDQAAGNEWYSGFHMSGYASQTFGMWQNPTTLRQYTPSRNNLATSRTLLQVDENYRLNEYNTFFMREWFVYEPPYSFNSANNKAYGAATPFHSSFGHFMNGYYNNYQVRDAWWENKWGPLTTFFGNQIVVWGQSLAFRVGDVINPADTCWAFGFANLEQSRNAQWMIHPVLNLPEMGPFSSNFIEGVWQPGFSPVYWPEQTNDPYNKYKSDLTAGRALPCLPAASHGPSARFDVGYDTRAFFGLQAPLGIFGPFVSNPASREFMLCNQLNGAVLPGFNYMPLSLRKPCTLTLNKHQHNFGPIGDGGLVDTGFWHVPGMQPQSWNEGARFHTLYGATELTALYYNDNTNGGAPWTLKWTPYTNLWNYSNFDIQEAGVTADRPLPMPASLGEYFPAVGRAEMLYTNHESFESNKPFDLTGQRYSDTVKWMVALDIDQAYAPWLTETGNLSANLEVFDQIVMDNCKLCGYGNDLGNDHQLKNNVNVLFNLGTSWLWSDIEPTWTMIFDPKGRTFALFPSLVLNPPWTKKYFVKLQAIEVLGGDRENNGIGLFKGQSLLTAQFQYNFNVL